MAVAKLTFSTDQIWLKGSGAAGQVWAVPVTGIPAGAVIKSVILTFSNGHQYNAPGGCNIYKGNDAITANRLWRTSSSLGGGSASVDITSYITGNGTYNLYFYKTANSGGTNSNVYFSSVKVTVTYEKESSVLKRAENGELVDYVLHRAENGSLVQYNPARAESGELVEY